MRKKKSRNQWVRRFAAAVLSGALLLTPAGAITAQGESETWFDGVWALIDTFGLKTENNPYVLQNYINKYLEEHPEEMYHVINDLLSTLDTHSMYLSAEEYSKGFSTLEGYVGIGVGLEQTASGVLIGEVIPYSAADEAGLKVGDLVVKVDGADALSLTTTEIAAKLRGEAGASITLTVRRQGRDINVTCTRRTVNNIYVSGKTVADGVEYIKVSAMGSENDWKMFEQLWDALPAKNTRAVVLDLRGNGGGVIDVALKMANKMVEKKDTSLAGVRWREDMGGLEQTFSTGGGLPLNKIVVLVDKGTASAAELLAGSLKDTGTATLLGETTYGKGQGQFHIDLVNGDKLVITTLEMELPKTGKYEGIGLTPNLMVDNRVVSVNAATLTPLDTSKTLRFGDTSDDVYAMTERLALLGLMDTSSRVFDGAALDAVSAFLASYEMEQTLNASPEMLQALDGAMRTLDGQTYMVDNQLHTAIELCKLAAAKPQRYTAAADGSWTAK